jgi:hypothetical protein
MENPRNSLPILGLTLGSTLLGEKGTKSPVGEDQERPGGRWMTAPQ